MERSKFEDLVQEGFELLPEWVRKKIKNVAILIEDEASAEVRRREHLRKNETLLGLYQGIPLSARGENYGVGATMPDTITLYQLPIEEAENRKFPYNAPIRGRVLERYIISGISANPPRRSC
ncbi:MAG: hypothetical protein UY63_C0003G0037 [Parcubacteria group bacterium GW2011_GWA2_51_10]|nr:MAG: hypothetical protein UY63_C0003G0037 [Parcubacteria group bacterium GW2011_GWA2_51_10]